MFPEQRMTPKPGQVWRSNQDDHEVVILMKASGRQILIRSVDDGAASSCDVTRFNRRGTWGYTFVRDADETERRQWGCV